MQVRCQDGPCDGRIEDVPDDAEPGWEFEVACPPVETDESDLIVSVYRLEEGGVARHVGPASGGDASSRSPA
jgi:hypothetical protein